MISLLDDNREIESVWTSSSDVERYWRVGREGVTSIQVYQEPGQMSMVTWCAVYVNEIVKHKFDMSGMGVTYK